MNLGARHATGEHLILLNDDIKVISPDWIEQMLQYSQLPDVGAVGAKLLFPNRRIQHAGIVLLMGNPGHAYYDHPPEEIGYYLSAAVPRNYLAVTGACTMTRAAVYRDAGGYSEDFPLNYNDVDYGLKLREKGYRIVYTPYAELFHYESVSKEGAGGVRPGELEKFHRKWRDKYFLDLTIIRIFRRITRIIIVRIKETVEGREGDRQRGWADADTVSFKRLVLRAVLRKGVSPAVIRVPRHLPRDSCLDGESGINRSASTARTSTASTRVRCGVI